MQPGAGPYEAWASVLKAWSVDPSTPLAGLPAITETTFDPQTFNRLMERIHDAQSAFMDRWTERLSTATSRARTDFELARELVTARSELRARVELVSHPGLPEPVRKALRTGIEADLQNLQQQLEESVTQNDSATRTDRAATSKMLLIVRQNAMTAILSSTSVTGQPSVAPRQIITS